MALCIRRVCQTSLVSCKDLNLEVLKCWFEALGGLVGVEFVVVGASAAGPSIAERSRNVLYLLGKEPDADGFGTHGEGHII